MLLLMPLLTWSVSVYAHLALQASATLDSPTRHVRATDAYAHRVLRDGYRRSPTLASLVDRLQASDLVVYVDAVPALRDELAARMTIVPSAAPHRYVRIVIGAERPLDDAIALLGHELRHAVEIADAPGVANNADVEFLYGCIGHEWGPHKYETDDAVDAEHQVRKELTASRRAF